MLRRRVRQTLNGVVRDLARAVWTPDTAPAATDPRTTDSGGTGPGKAMGEAGHGSHPQKSGVSDYPGDFTGCPTLVYDPHPDGIADPGEVVWTWVPFEEDLSGGKDRPVLVIGRDGRWLLALPLTSKDHDRDMTQENAAGRWWIDIGSGEWDRQQRPSEARVDRIIRVDPEAVRRTAGRLPRDRFELVAEAVALHWAD